MLVGEVWVKFSPELTTSSPAAAIVSPSDVSGVMLCQFPPALVVRTAAGAWFAVVAVVGVVTEAVAERAGVHIVGSNSKLF